MLDRHVRLSKELKREGGEKLAGEKITMQARWA